MKKNILYPVIFFALSLLFIGCKQISRLTKFDFPLEQTLDLPAIPVPLSNVPITKSVKTEYKTFLSTIGASTNLVESIQLKSFILMLNAPETGSFNFIDSVKIGISTETLNNVIVARKKNILSIVGKELELDVDNTVNLKDYILNDSVNLNVSLTTNKATTQTYNIKAKAIFNIDVNVLGL